VTIYGHTIVMRKIGIAELKAQLSENLRAVRAGEVIVVLDRTTPVARIVPIEERSVLSVRRPALGAIALNRVPLPKAAKLKVDVLQLLLEERQNWR
jgi:prevent-host-death family protein